MRLLIQVVVQFSDLPCFKDSSQGAGQVLLRRSFRRFRQFEDTWFGLQDLTQE